MLWLTPTLTFILYFSTLYFVDTLLRIVEKRTIFWPGDWKSDILDFSSSLSSYAEELSQALSKQESRQSQLVQLARLVLDLKACQL